MSTKVIVVSTPEIHSYFTKTRTDWDTQSVTTNISDMWEGLQNGTLDTETEYVIFGEEVYDVDPQGFCKAVATFAPVALVMVISYTAATQDKIRAQVLEEFEQGVNGPFHFITPEKIEDDIDVAIQLWHRRAETGQVEVEAHISTEPQATPSKPKPVDESATAQNMNVDFGKRYGLKPLGQRGIIIASTSSKGGSGKTTVALCTASMIHHASRLAHQKGLIEKPLSVVVVDMDVRDGQVGFLLGQQSPTALKYYVENDFSKEALAANIVQSPGMGISALLAPKVPKMAGYLDVDFYGDTITKLTEMYDVVMIDTSVNYLDRLLGSLVLPIADVVMFVTNMSRGSISGMARWMAEVTSPREDGSDGLSKDKIGIVINQSMKDVGIDLPEITKNAMDATLLSAIPLDSAAVVTATNEYRLQDVVLKHPTISPAYFKVVEKIFGKDKFIAPHELLAQASLGTQTTSQPVPVGKKKKGGLFR